MDTSENSDGAYDVFICFKDLDEAGNPTPDSALAMEIYNYLSSHGIKTFFSNVSLEKLGVAEYKQAIDNALDAVSVLIAVGTKVEYLESQWVRYEWDSFHNDILSGRKPKGRIFSYIDAININFLPRTLRINQVIAHNETGSIVLLYNFISNALDIQILAKVTEESKTTVHQLNRLIELMAESRLLELEITANMFGQLFSPEQKDRINQHIFELRQLTKKP
jgi:hypothetical protein